MNIELTDEHFYIKKKAKEFVDKYIVPFAETFDHNQEIDKSTIELLGKHGYLTPMVPESFGGLDIDFLSIGYLNEEIGRGCSSIRSLMTVHGMVALAILKCGTEEQKREWLPKLGSGEKIASFCISEEESGSDINGISTNSTELDSDTLLLNGSKKWITFGQIADVFLMFAQSEKGPIAVLVEKGTPGLTIEPINDILGVRASMIAKITMDKCRVSKKNIVGSVGMGLSYISTICLDYGRYTVAWGCVGSAQACLESSIKYTNNRRQFGNILKDYQLIQKMITEMLVGINASRLLCINAGYLKQKKDPNSIMETWCAKYSASKTYSKVSSDAVQIHGAIGTLATSAVQRHYRDAKIMEIIEGTSQMHEIQIASYADRLFKE